MANSLDLGKVKGSQMHNVSSAPATSLGLEGDWALNPTTGDVYEKTTTAWEKRGNFKGAKGDKGDKGDPGTPGTIAEHPTFSIDSNGHLIATYA